MDRLPRFTLLFLHNPHKISPQPYYTENLGIQYIAGVLRADGYSAKVINSDYQNMSHDTLVRTILDTTPTVFGMAPCYITMGDALEIAEAIKKRAPHIWTCLGGHHATFCADDILRTEACIDFVVRGEGERSILQLARSIEAHSGRTSMWSHIASIDGLSYRHGGSVSHNKDSPLLDDLNSIPFPVRDSLDTVSQQGDHAMPLICTSRGCPANCSFCSTPRFYHRTWRGRSSVNTVDEIEQIAGAYGFTQFYITDDQFVGCGAAGKDHVTGIIKEIKRRDLHRRYDLHFFLMARADFFTLENEDIVAEFPDVGFRDIFIGFESADSSELSLYRKGSTLRQYHAAIDMLHSYDLFVEGGFILFNPYSTFAGLRMDAALIKYLGVPLFGYYTKELMVLPGTSLFDRLVTDGMMAFHSYKNIRFRYGDLRIGRLYEYVAEFFAQFEEADNLLFDVVDFGVKAKGVLRKNRRIADREPLERFLHNLQSCSETLLELNDRFFRTVLNIFENGGTSEDCVVHQQRFESEHHGLLRPLVDEFLVLNRHLEIIRGR